MQRKDTLNSDPVRDLPNRECRVGCPLPLSDYNTLEDLNTFLVSFFDLNIHFYRITGLEIGQIKPPLFLFHCPDRFQVILLLFPILKQPFSPPGTNQRPELLVRD